MELQLLVFRALSRDTQIRKARGDYDRYADKQRTREQQVMELEKQVIPVSDLYNTYVHLQRERERERGREGGRERKRERQRVMRIHTEP